uniref:Uncharacterized protein n=1 Tax=Myoviridae sp. ctj3P51 TaxID=2826687 RepID=A0A8S5NQ14_9CAUD|nr:MAG TPA: hypothetical protein [Myoviridae sp. ctj3P51]
MLLLSGEIPVGHDTERSTVGVIGHLNLRHLTNECRRVGHLIDIRQRNIVLNRIRDIHSHELLSLLVRNDTALGIGAHIVQSRTAFNTQLQITSLSSAEVMVKQVLIQRAGVQGRETRHEVRHHERRNQNRIGENCRVHVGLGEVSLKDSVEERNNRSIRQACKALTSRTSIRNRRSHNVIAVEQTLAIADTGIDAILNEQVPTSNNRVVVDVLNGLLERQLLHLLQFNEPQVICHLVGVDLNAHLVQPGINARNVVDTVADNVSLSVHDTSPVNAVVFNEINKSAARFKRDVLLPRYKVKRLIQLLMQLCKSRRQECKVGVMNLSVANQSASLTGTVHITQGNRTTSLGGFNAFCEELIAERSILSKHYILSSLIRR